MKVLFRDESIDHNLAVSGVIVAERRDPTVEGCGLLVLPK